MEAGLIEKSAVPIAAIVGVGSVLYRLIFRPLLKKAIDNPDEEWDDAVLAACDAFFGHSSS